MQGSNGHNNGNDGDGSDSSGNDSNIIRLPTPEERAEQARQQKIRTTIFMGSSTDAGGKTHTHSPMINLPPMTKILVIALLAIELGLKLLPEQQQYWVMANFGFVPAYYTGDLDFTLTALAGPLTYAFLHGGWGHVAMNVVMLMAFGTGLERWMGWRRLAILMLASSLIAAFIHFLFSIGSNDPVIGASGGISGMFAAVLVMLQQTQNLNGGTGRFGLWPLAALWIGITVLFGMLGGPGGENIAWIAHIGGFLAGFLLIQPVMRLKV